jgi:hypothetical protein
VHALTKLSRTAAAVDRVPEIKPEDVEEVFFGNVLSAKCVFTPIFIPLTPEDSQTDHILTALARLLPASAPSVPASPTPSSPQQ